MGQPTGGDLHVSTPLTNISIAWTQDQTDFAADRIFPPVPVDHRSDQYYVFDRGDWFRTAARKRAPRTESAGSGWGLSRDNYTADVNAVHTDVADQDRADQDNQINLDRNATKFVTRDIWLRRELDWVDAYFGPSLWTNTDQQGAATAAANQFIQWDRTSSTPIEDIETVRINQGELTGFRPNVLAIGARVYSVWKNHPQFIERIKYSEKGIVTKELIAALMDLDEIVIPYSIQNTGIEGAADSFSYIHGKHALLAYRAPNPGLEVPTAGYTFEWTGYLGAETRGTRVTKFRMENLKADRVEVESAYTFKMVAGEMGTFFKDAVR